MVGGGGGEFLNNQLLRPMVTVEVDVDLLALNYHSEVNKICYHVSIDHAMYSSSGTKVGYSISNRLGNSFIRYLMNSSVLYLKHRNKFAAFTVVVQY